MNKQQRDDMVISMINQGMTHRDINKESGVPIATISDIRKRYGMAVAEEDDSLEAILLKLQSKGIHLNLEKNGTIFVHKPRVVEPYQGGDKNNVLVIGDLHSPYDLDEYLYFCRGMQEQFNCGTVIYIGDIADFHSMMYHEKIPEELNPQGEMSMTRKRLADWYYTFPEATVLLGNHDCYSDDTQVLTNRGFINHNELKPNDLIGTMNESGYIEYQNYVGYFTREHKGDMHHFSGVSTDALVTPNHRMYIHQNREKISKYEIAENLIITDKNSKRSFRTCFLNKNKDVELSDDIIEFLGYIYGYGSFTKSGGFIIYQQESKVGKIIDCANRVGLGFRQELRERTIDNICGKELIKKTNTHAALHFNKKHSNNIEIITKYLTERYVLPEIIQNLSTRQFRIFYEALQYCDASTKGTYSQLDGKLEFLQQLEILCISHGYNARVLEYREGSYRLTTNKDRFNVMYASHSTTHYDGIVWCLTTPNSNLIVKRNNCISVQGNCLPYRKAQTAGLLREFIRDEHEIFGAPDTYKFLHEIEIDGVLYTHGSHGNAMEKCVKLGMNLVQGHLHTAAGVRRWKTRKGQIFGMQVGTGINYKKKVFDYAKSNAVDPVLGCGVVLNEGELPIFIPMNT